MDMLNWAKKEIDIAIKNEKRDKDTDEFRCEYAKACYESAFKAYETLMGDGHSGLSIGATKYILNRLIDTLPLTPIEDTDDVWNLVTEEDDGAKLYQCARMSSLFKRVKSDGTVSYSDNSACYCINKGEDSMGYHSSFVSKIFHEMYPITMPYMPADRPSIAVCEEFLTDTKNGDFDTMAILYIKRPDGLRAEVNRYFKDSDTGDGFEEISKEEYEERRKLAKSIKEDL